MHDVNGNLLKVGDKVNVPCVVKELYGGENECNVQLETVHGRRPDSRKEVIGCINTGVTELVRSITDAPNIHDWIIFKSDGRSRSPLVVDVLRHFLCSHLPEHLQATSRHCAQVACAMADTLEENSDLIFGLRDLLAAKDNFVRAKLLR